MRRRLALRRRRAAIWRVKQANAKRAWAARLRYRRARAAYWRLKHSRAAANSRRV
jgi:hypothetical protein